MFSLKLLPFGLKIFQLKAIRCLQFVLPFKISAPRKNYAVDDNNSQTNNTDRLILFKMGHHPIMALWWHWVLITAHPKSCSARCRKHYSHPVVAPHPSRSSVPRRVNTINGLKQFISSLYTPSSAVSLRLINFYLITEIKK